jgi:NADH:ubiquinone oxidoreductase subunit F (NADH-binding)/NADH:ubiquinone oxidoreductase subunit E
MASPAPVAEGSPPHNDITSDPVRQTVTWELLELQRRRGYLSDQDLIDLAQRLGKHLIELEQVVGFFPHFRRSPPPKCELHVCRDLACAHRDAETILEHLTKAFPEPQDPRQTPAIAVRPVSCLGRCDRAPAVLIELPQTGDHAHAPAARRDQPPLPHVIAAHGDAVDPTTFDPLKFAGELANTARGLCDNPREALKGLPNQSDAAHSPNTLSDWRIDPYRKKRYPALHRLLDSYARETGRGEAAIDGVNRGGASAKAADKSHDKPPMPDGDKRPEARANSEVHDQQWIDVEKRRWKAAFEGVGLGDALTNAADKSLDEPRMPARDKWPEACVISKTHDQRWIIVCDLTVQQAGEQLASPDLALVLEGLLLMGLYVDACKLVINVRDEADPMMQAIQKAIHAVTDTKLLGLIKERTQRECEFAICHGPTLAEDRKPEDRLKERLPQLPPKTWLLSFGPRILALLASQLAPAYESIRQLQTIHGRLGGNWQSIWSAFPLDEALKNANLRGMGGGGTPAVQKWKNVREATSEKSLKYVVCNADESEPLTFKDRELLLHAPHLIIEGMILAGLYVGAERGYIYLRHEYHEQAAAIRQALRDAAARRVCGANVLGMGRDFHLDLFISPGGYICGEQSALIEAMEGHRAQPRPKPPNLETNGLFDEPTLLSNVETYAWVPAIMLSGGPAERQIDRLVEVWKTGRTGYITARLKWRKDHEARCLKASGTSGDSQSPDKSDQQSAFLTIDNLPHTKSVESENEQSKEQAKTSAVALDIEPGAPGWWYAAQGAMLDDDDRGRRFFSICGDVRRPGVHELPIGAPLRDLIAAAGGVLDDREVLAVATSGPSGGFLPAVIEDADLMRGIDLAWRRWLEDAEKKIDKVLHRISEGVNTIRNQHVELKAETVRQADNKKTLNSVSDESRHSIRDAQARIDDNYRKIEKAEKELFDGSRSKYAEWRMYHRWKGTVERSDPATGRRWFDLLAMPMEIELYRTVLGGLLSTGRAANDPERPWRHPALLAIKAKPLLGAGLGVFAKTGSPEQDRRLLAMLARNATEFFQRESCGKCVPCRVGSVRMVDRLVELQTAGRFERQALEPADWNELTEWVSVMDTTLAQTSICALGASVSAPMVTTLKFFSHDMSGPSGDHPSPDRG